MRRKIKVFWDKTAQEDYSVFISCYLFSWLWVLPYMDLTPFTPAGDISVLLWILEIPGFEGNLGEGRKMPESHWNPMRAKPQPSVLLFYFVFYSFRMELIALWSIQKDSDMTSSSQTDDYWITNWNLGGNVAKGSLNTWLVLCLLCNHLLSFALVAVTYTKLIIMFNVH